MANQLRSPRTFNPDGLYVFYNSDKRGGVYIQNGVVFAENHTDLEYEFLYDEDKLQGENFLSWLNRRGFTMDTDFRRALTRAKLERQHQERVEQSRREMLEREQAEMERMESQLRKQMRQSQIVDPIPPLQVQRPPEPIELSDVEKEAWGEDLSQMFPDLGSAEKEPEFFPVLNQQDEQLAVVSRTKKKASSSSSAGK